LQSQYTTKGLLNFGQAFNYGISHKDDLFKDSVLIFLGVNNISSAIEAGRNDHITGIIESLSYRGTLDTAVKIYPRAKNIVAITDEGFSSDVERSYFYALEKFYPDYTFSEINSTHYSENALLAKIATLDDSSILLYISCSEDALGNRYIPKEIMKKISSNARIPVFAIDAYPIGKGILGGEVVNQEKMGYQAGDIAEKILQGTSPKLFSVQSNTPRKYIFDESQMRRFGIRMQDIPAQADIINHKYSWGEKHQTLVRNIFIIMAVIGILILIPLFIENRMKDKKNVSISKLNEMLDRSNKYDHLTNLLNRSIFDADLNHLMEENKPFTILMYDLDNFKNVNDTYGHNQGDAVLCELARRAQSLSDSFFTIYRLAGDEFTAIITNNDRKHVESYVHEIQNRMNEPYDIGDTFLNLHASIGVAVWPEDAENKTELVAAADKAMYHVKNNGKGGFCWYQDIKQEVQDFGEGRKKSESHKAYPGACQYILPF